MRHSTSLRGGLFQQPPRLLVAMLWLSALWLMFPFSKHSGSVLASPEVLTTVESTLDFSSDLASEPDMTQQSVQLDPLNSPYPIPWSWVLATQDEGNVGTAPRLRYYRTQALISPDGQLAAYSRIQMQVMPDSTRSRINSVLFVENLRTGDLQTVTAASPFADNPFAPNAEPQRAGTIAILIPVAWSVEGDRILAREFESLFGTDIASDFAVIWERQSNRIRTIAPNGVQYSNAILLGWSQTNPDRVLFRAGNIGDEDWNLWAVDFSGQTIAAIEDRPVTFGQTVTNVWAGPQAHR